MVDRREYKRTWAVKYRADLKAAGKPHDPSATRERSRKQVDLKTRAGVLVREAKYRAKRDGRTFDLTVEWLIQQHSVQGGLCAYSRAPLTLLLDRSTCLSIDRRDPARGYVQDNCHLVSSRVNRVKSDLTHEEFIMLCKQVAADG